MVEAQAIDVPREPPPLVAHSKLMPPRVRQEVVRHQDLVDRVLGSKCQVTAIIGPAGSGKSTVMSQLHAAESCAVWYSAEEDDDDPVVLWWGLIEAIRGVAPDFGDRYRHRLTTAGSAVVDETVVAVANELATLESPPHVFIDDVHRISKITSRRSLHRLVTHLPDGPRVTFSSRHSTTIPLARLRVQGNLLEVGASDLALTTEDARLVLEGLGVHASSAVVEVLVDRTEGWPAGLQLAGMALTRTEDPETFVSGFCGTDRLVADYLVTEVLDRVSPDDAEFMIETSVLDELSGELCDAVTGRTDSADRIRRLEATNAFIIPLDRTGQWYRYHHLFSDLLGARLREQDPAHLRVTHGRAFEWLRDEGDLSEAIPHGLAAGRRREAADLVCEYWWHLVNTGRLHTARDLVDRFDSHEMETHQPLAIASAIIDGLSGDLRGARRCLSAATRSEYDGPPPDGSANSISSLALARGTLALHGLDEALADGQTAYELEPPGTPWRQLAALIIGLARAMRGEAELAKPFFEEASGAEDVGLRVYALAELALVHLDESDIGSAEREANEARRLIAEAGLEDLVQAATTFGAAAYVALAQGDSIQAASLLSAAERPLSYVDLGLPMDVMHAALLLAGVALALGDSDSARRHLELAAGIDATVDDTGALSEKLAELHSELPLRVDSDTELRGEELTERELEVLQLLPTGLTNREIGQELFLSRNTIKTYLSGVYRRLGVSSRSEAVQRGVELGLLEGPPQAVESTGDDPDSV